MQINHINSDLYHFPAIDLRKCVNLRALYSLLLELHPEVSPSKRLPRLSCRQTAWYRDDRGESRREVKQRRTITIGYLVVNGSLLSIDRN